MRGTIVLLSAAIIMGLASSVARAEDASGTWARDTGESKVRIAPCGAALCGTITWLKSPGGKAKVGERVFFDMKPAGANQWNGKAFNPEDGQNYTGKMTLDGNKLTTSGCVLGGLVCKSVTWTRAN